MRPGPWIGVVANSSIDLMACGYPPALCIFSFLSAFGDRALPECAFAYVISICLHLVSLHSHHLEHGGACQTCLIALYCVWCKWVECCLLAHRSPEVVWNRFWQWHWSFWLEFCSLWCHHGGMRNRFFGFQSLVAGLGSSSNNLFLGQCWVLFFPKHPWEMCQKRWAGKKLVSLTSRSIMYSFVLVGCDTSRGLSSWCHWTRTKPSWIMATHYPNNCVDP